MIPIVSRFAAFRLPATVEARVWAFSNHRQSALLMPAKVKRRALEVIRLRIKSKSRKIARLKLFAMGTYLLIEDHLQDIQGIVIDREYEGQPSEAKIRSFLLEYIWQARPDFPKEASDFGKIKLGSPPDALAYAVHKQKRPPDLRATLKDVYRLLA